MKRFSALALALMIPAFAVAQPIGAAPREALPLVLAYASIPDTATVLQTPALKQRPIIRLTGGLPEPAAAARLAPLRDGGILAISVAAWPKPADLSRLLHVPKAWSIVLICPGLPTAQNLQALVHASRPVEILIPRVDPRQLDPMLAGARKVSASNRGERIHAAICGVRYEPRRYRP